MRDNDLKASPLLALGIAHTNSFLHPWLSIFMSHGCLGMLFVLEHNEAIGTYTRGPISNNFDLQNGSILRESSLQDPVVVKGAKECNKGVGLTNTLASSTRGGR